MFAIILILILVGFYAYYAYTECEDLVPTIFVCFFIAFAVSLLFGVTTCLFTTDFEYSIAYDSYSISDDGLIHGCTVHYFVNDEYSKIHVDNVDVFTGEDRGIFIIR